MRLMEGNLKTTPKKNRKRPEGVATEQELGRAGFMYFQKWRIGIPQGKKARGNAIGKREHIKIYGRNPGRST